MNQLHSEEAVSQVLGVILMVSLAVILAAVTASFVLSMTGSLQTMKFVSVTSDINEDGTATFTIQGGDDLKTVTAIDLIYQDGTVEHHFFGASPQAGATNTSSSSVAGQRIVLAASFVDGTQIMILEKEF